MSHATHSIATPSDAAAGRLWQALRSLLPLQARLPRPEPVPPGATPIDDRALDELAQLDDAALATLCRGAEGVQLLRQQAAYRTATQSIDRCRLELFRPLN